MKRNGLRIILAASLLAAAIACNKDGTWTGNGLTPNFVDYLDGKGVFADIRTLVITDEAGPTFRDAQNTAFKITAAEALVDRVELKLPADETCGTFTEIIKWPALSCLNGVVRVNGPYRANLLNGSLVPSLLNVPLPLTRFQWIRIYFEPAIPDDGLVDAGEDLAGRSLWVEGDYGDPLDGVQFQIPVETPFHVQIDGPISELNNGLLDIRLDASVWLAETGVTDCVTNNYLTINSDVLVVENGTGGCTTLETDLVQAIEGSGSVNTD